MSPRSEIARSLLSLEMQPLRMKLEALQLDELRRMFLALGERSSSAVNSAGCDHDDTIQERYILCGLEHERVHAIASDFLSSSETFESHVVASLCEVRAGAAAISGEVRVMGLMVKTIHEQWV